MNQFQDIGLNPMILQALEDLGFDKPTPIQVETIPHLINCETDLVALAQTGTGKTAAFSLPIVQKLEKNVSSVQCLILCPTRELAIQVSKDIESFMKYLSFFRVLPVFGGERIDKQIRAFRDKPSIIVGTPGRVNDLIRRKVLKVDEIKWLVLDEADEMLNMGFKDDLDEILRDMPEEKQVLLFSATMNSAIRRIAENYMDNPTDISVGNKNKGTDNVQHFYYVVREKDRYDAFKRIIDMNPGIHGIVFCRTRRETQMIADKLIRDSYSAEAIHGEISQQQRTYAMNRFRAKKIRLLIATDVAARGIDVSGLTHVINYNLPESDEAYLHRSGRTGRAHNEGISMLLINSREQYKIKHLERKIGKSFDKAKIPLGKDICERQLLNCVDKICNIEVDSGSQLDKYMDFVNSKFENVSKEELIKKLLAEEFDRFLNQYKSCEDLNMNVKKDKGGEQKSLSMLFARFNINLGKKDGMSIKDFLSLINSQAALKGVEIGNVDIFDNHTVFELDEGFEKKATDSFSQMELNGLVVKIKCEGRGIRSTMVKFKKPRARGGRDYGAKRNDNRRRDGGNDRNRRRKKRY